jgi:hypothetical protein
VSRPRRGTREDDFIARWNLLDRKDRMRLRRLVRMGRPVADREEAELAVDYARFQASRSWARMFWLWFVPGIALAVTAAAKLHPLVIGMVLALGAQAAFAHVNLRRVESVNAVLLGTSRTRKRRR